MHFLKRSYSGGSAGISPIAYYRLGQSYPRSEARQAYPHRRRRFFIAPTSELQTLSPSSVASLEVFGTAQLNQQIIANTIISLAAIPQPALDLIIMAAGNMPSLGTVPAPDFGTGVVILYPDSMASQEAPGDPTLITGPVILDPSAIISIEAFGTAVIELYLLPSSIASIEAHGSPTLTVGPAIIAPSGVITVEIFGSVVILGGEIAVPEILDFTLTVSLTPEHQLARTTLRIYDLGLLRIVRRNVMRDDVVLFEAES